MQFMKWENAVSKCYGSEGIGLLLKESVVPNLPGYLSKPTNHQQTETMDIFTHKTFGPITTQLNPYDSDEENDAHIAKSFPHFVAPESYGLKI